MDTKKYFTDKRYVVIIAVCCSVLWGSAFPLLKVSYVEMKIATGDIYAKMMFAGIRFLLAAILLFIFIKLAIRLPLKFEKKYFGGLLLLGILQTTLSLFFLYNGLSYTSGVKGSILTSTITLFVVILSHFIYADDKINTKKIIGLVAGFLGIYLANKGKGAFNFDFSFRGEGFLLIYGIVNAFAFVLTKRLTRSVHPFLVTSWQMFLGSALLIGFSFYGLQPNSMIFTSKAWALLAYLIVFPSVIAFTLWFTLLKYNKTGEIVIYNFIMPLAGSVFSTFLIPGEKFTLYLMLALVLVSFSVIVINFQRKQKAIK